MGLYLGEIEIPNIIITTDSADNSEEILQLIGKGEIK